MSDTEFLPLQGMEDDAPAPTRTPTPPPAATPEPAAPPPEQTAQDAEPPAPPATDEGEQQPRRRQRKPDAEQRINILHAQLAQERREKQELERRLRLTQDSGLRASEGHLSAALTNARVAYRAARAEGDIEKEAEAVERISELKAELRQIAREKAEMAPEQAWQPQPPQPQPQPPPQQQQYYQPQSTTTPRTEQWLAENPWFREDPVMNQVAREASEEALRQGMINDSERYWRYIDRVVREEFPDHFQPQRQARVPQPHAGQQPPPPPPPVMAGQPAVYRQPNAPQPQRPAPVKPPPLTKEERAFRRNFGWSENEVL